MGSTAMKNPVVPGAALHAVFNHVFPSDEPDIWRWMSMWSIWMFTITSQRALDCLKEALNYLFLLIPFFLKSFASHLVRRHCRVLRYVRLGDSLVGSREDLTNLIPMSVKTMIYLDSDHVVVDDIAKLWDVNLEEKVLAAPESCHANFTKYFTDLFWSDLVLARTFEGRRPCYFNTVVMVVNVDKWRVGGYTQKVEEWMSVQKQKRIYHLGSFPPFLLVLAVNIKAVDHW